LMKNEGDNDSNEIKKGANLEGNFILPQKGDTPGENEMTGEAETDTRNEGRGKKTLISQTQTRWTIESRKKGEGKGSVKTGVEFKTRMEFRRNK